MHRQRMPIALIDTQRMFIRCMLAARTSRHTAAAPSHHAAHPSTAHAETPLLPSIPHAAECPAHSICPWARHAEHTVSYHNTSCALKMMHLCIAACLAYKSCPAATLIALAHHNLLLMSTHSGTPANQSMLTSAAGVELLAICASTLCTHHHGIRCSCSKHAAAAAHAACMHAACHASMLPTLGVDTACNTAVHMCIKLTYLHVTFRHQDLL